jgi:hypothetical protein
MVVLGPIEADEVIEAEGGIGLLLVHSPFSFRARSPADG